MSFTDDDSLSLQQQLILERQKTTALLRLTQSETPQQLIETLLDYLQDDQIDICSLWLCGPNALNSKHELAAQVELVAMSSSAEHPGVELGTKLNVDDTEVMSYLLEDDLLLSEQVTSQFTAQDVVLGSLTQMFEVEHWALFALKSTHRCYGMLFIGTRGSFEWVTPVAHLLPIISMRFSQYALERDQIRNLYGRNALIDAVNDGILVTYPTTDDGSRVLMMNERFRKLFNLHETVYGLPLDVMLEKLQVQPSLRQYLSAMWGQIAADERATKEGTFEMVTANGYPAEISWYSSPILETVTNDEVFGRLFILHDVTPERAATQIRSAFLSRVSHELRTPLMAISGFAEALLESRSPELHEDNREYVNIIHQSAGRLKLLFTELIEITRAEAGQLVLDLGPIHLRDTLQAIIQQYEAEYHPRNQTVTLEHADPLPTVHADHDRMTRVLDNLIANAVRYTPEGGQITVTMKPIMNENDLPSTAPDDVIVPALLLSVIDSGDGIPAEEVEQIFEPFYRTQTAWKHQIEGTGLGLALSRSLVELHRGRIWAEPATPNNPGGRFHFTIPIATTR